MNPDSDMFLNQQCRSRVQPWLSRLGLKGAPSPSTTLVTLYIESKELILVIGFEKSMQMLDNLRTLSQVHSQRFQNHQNQMKDIMKLIGNLHVGHRACRKIIRSKLLKGL